MIFASCGRITEEKATESTVLKEVNSQTCNSEGIEFSHILEKDMGEEISCLETSINAFFESVETKTKNQVTKDELLKFLAKFTKSKNYEKGIDLLFSFNSLIKGDQPNIIQRNSFHSLLKILRAFNKEMSEIYSFIQEIEDERRPLRHRDEIKESSPRISLDLNLKRRVLIKAAAQRLKVVFEENFVRNRAKVDVLSLAELLQKIERRDSIYDTLKEMTDFSHDTITSMIDMILEEKDDRESLKKILSTYPLSKELAETIVPLVKNHIPDGNEELVKKLNALLFVKRIYLGGDKNQITHIEFARLINLIPDLMTIVYDLISFPYVEYGSLQNKFSLLADDIDFLIKQVAFEPGSFEKLFSINELVQSLDALNFKFSDSKVSSFVESVKNVKVMVLGGDREIFTVKDFSLLAQKAQYAMDMSRFAFEMYEDNQYLLSPSLPLSKEGIKKLNDYYVVTTQESSHKNRFVRIVESYRLFNGSFEIPFYNNGVRRNAEGVVEIMLFDYVFGELFAYLNKVPSNPDKNHELKLEKDHILLVLKQIDDFLRVNDLSPTKPERTADNVRLVTDLFQTQSNGDSKLNLNEAIEFLSLLRDAVNIAKSVKEEYQKNKSCDFLANGGISVKCYREHFFKMLEPKKKSFEKLFDFVDKAIKNNELEKLSELLKRTEYFTRECALETRPMLEKDFTVLIGGLLNIESTLIHFDVNEDNELNYDELEQAFPIYRAAIIGAAQLKKWQEPLARSIFFYLVKYQKLPSNLELISFAAKFETVGDKKIKGDRVTIATLLKYINSMNAVEDPNCR